MAHGIGRQGHGEARDGLVGFAEKLKERFFGHRGLDMEIAGIALDWAGDTHSPGHAHHRIILGGEPALREVLESKGHAGLKVCNVCQDIVMQTSPTGMVGIDAGGSAHRMASTCVYDSLRHTDHSIRTMPARGRPQK